ncbi:MAG TPA: cell division protein FtsQ/DivIB, partial [Pyrinomonadaceae bacterium]|nr:cell division protein FtsQ/DivIB [Pyrinomonadaceae bacterium]
LAERVSEVNLDDLRDVRAQLAGADSQVEVRLGKDDLTKRLRQALQALDEQRQTPRGALISYIDMTQGKRAVIGFMRAQLPAQSSEGANSNIAASDAPMAQPRAADVAIRQRASARTTPRAQTVRSAPVRQPKPVQAREAAHETKRAAEPPRGIEQRPRRVVLKTG